MSCHEIDSQIPFDLFVQHSGWWSLVCKRCFVSAILQSTGRERAVHQNFVCFSSSYSDPSERRHVPAVSVAHQAATSR